MPRQRSGLEDESYLSRMLRNPTPDVGSASASGLARLLGDTSELGCLKPLLMHCGPRD